MASYWKKTGRKPKIDDLIKIANVLDCTVADLVGDEADTVGTIFDAQKTSRDRDDIRDFVNLYNRLTNKDKTRLMTLVYDFEDEMNAMYRENDGE